MSAKTQKHKRKPTEASPHTAGEQDQYHPQYTPRSRLAVSHQPCLLSSSQKRQGSTAYRSPWRTPHQLILAMPPHSVASTHTLPQAAIFIHHTHHHHELTDTIITTCQIIRQEWVRNNSPRAYQEQTRHISIRNLRVPGNGNLRMAGMRLRLTAALPFLVNF